jgi:hypothetical protein
MNVKSLLSILCVSTCAAVATYGSSASAASYVTCSVDRVAWNPGVGSGELQISCSGTTWYYADVSTATCTGKGSDTLKAWMTLGESALLSGKPLYIEFSGSCMSYVRLGG